MCVRVCGWGGGNALMRQYVAQLPLDEHDVYRILIRSAAALRCITNWIPIWPS